MNNNWQIEETVFAVGAARAYEGLFTQGSGYIHSRGSIEEHFTDSPQNTTYLRMPGNVTAEKFPVTHAKWGTYIPGVFGAHPTLGLEMVNLPFFWLCVPWVDGERLEMTQSAISGYSRVLDFKNGVLTRSFKWAAKSGALVDVKFERFISAARPHLAAQRMTICPDQNISLVIETGIDTDVRTSGYDHLVKRSVSAEGPDVRATVTTDHGETVTMLSRVAIPSGDWKPEVDGRKGMLSRTLTVEAGSVCVFERHTVTAASRDLETVDPEQELASAIASGYDALALENEKTRAGRWACCDVEIEGDEESLLALRCSLYHLLRCHVTGDSRVAIDAKGYAGDAYFGRFFWDTEMYMLPFYLYTDPERARTFVDFRVQGLNGARANAAAYGYPGARYPWESDPEGFERCPNWQYRDHEIHVTGDVVYGMAHFDKACPQAGFLKGEAATALVETARYWMARVDYRDGEKTPSLLGVMGPDEYAPITANNAYTNRLAAFALELASGDTGRLGGATDEERAAFAEVARTLPIHRAAENSLVLQCEEFPRLADPRFDELWTNRATGYANNVSQERLYRSKALKQADVLMLMTLFPNEFSREEVEAAWNYYLPYTTHDSSLSAGVHALVACRMGYREEAWRYWLKTIGYDLDIKHGGAAEGIHIANAAASWMVAVFGFAGVSTVMESDELAIRPALPGQWTRLAFPMVWKGAPVFIEISPTEIAVTNRGSRILQVHVCDNSFKVAPGGISRVAYTCR